MLGLCTVSPDRGAAEGRHIEMSQQVSILLFLVPLGFSVQPAFCVLLSLFFWFELPLLGEVSGRISRSCFKMAGREREREREREMFASWVPCDLGGRGAQGPPEWLSPDTHPRVNS